MTVVVALALLVAPGEPPATWCTEALAALDKDDRPHGEEAWPRYESLEALFPPEQSSTVVRARGLVTEEGDFGEAYRTLRAAATAACWPVSVAEIEARSEVTRILQDPVFQGVREEPDFVDELIARVQDWLTELFESEGMQRYAESTRFVFLALLVVAALLVAYRLFRVRRDAQAGGAASSPVAVEIARRQTAASLLVEAHRHLEDGALRGAVHAGFLALLARLGELDEGAVHPARTNREILADLDGARRAVVERCFAAYEASIYRGELDPEATSAAPDRARDFVVLVERTLGVLA